MAQGEYVMFLDADDALLPDALESMVTSASGEDVVIGGYGVFINNVPSSEVMPADTVSYKGHDYARFFEDNLLPYCELLDAPWAKLFRTKAIRRIRFNEDMDYAEDKLFVFEVLSKCTSILTVSKAVYGYYKRPGSLGSDISSDQHIRKLQIFLQRYVPLISVLCERCPSVATVQYLYHNDVVSRYLCRILNIFATRDSEMLNEETLSWVYSMMDADKNLGGVFSLRIGQVPNMYLYRKRNISKSIKRYKFFQKITRLFHKNK
jgi:glycosyltransferase involved in cell wall biosynthesis